MDPLTQGVLGATLPQATAARGKRVAAAGLLGFLAGMAADLDVFIRSSDDPLLFLEYHRQFTHALIFIPVGGLICALVLHLLLGRKRGLEFRQSWLYCTLGYATHALLDACTTYGTMLFWPFSDVRIA
jgi:inner membrane protein